MATEKLQHLQDENYLTTTQISEGNDGQSVKGKELIEATVFEVHAEQVQKVLQESLKLEIKPNGCITVRPCPTTSNPQGCIVC
ncbi:hypothetical protein NIES4071_107480 (plasmid) [Calothrix sp. NIES-4071]|nr:hypothetical protein NIES4071_107480 [Calothrix sp. NIES-4071]BAZ64788.1 hypothetical protein NIES4105_105210 [Calothrix sp. NIES-4105]